MSQKLAYRIPEAVEVSGIGRTTLYKAIDTRKGPPALKSFTVGRRRLIAATDLEDFIERLRRGEVELAENVEASRDDRHREPVG